jgi:two-component system chemotaxis response regulator CheB
MIRVLIVEDSPVVQELLTHILTSDPGITVAGVANDGKIAISSVERLKPDVITMDINMPNLNGYETTRRIMESTPVPIIIVSGSCNASDPDNSFDAMEAGALAILRKPTGLGHPEHLADAAALIRTVKLMSEIKVVRRWPRIRRETPVPNLPTSTKGIMKGTIQIVAIGASTGGPAVIQKIFSALPKELSVPVVVVQHMASGFMENFVSWLSATTGFPASIAVQGEYLTPGHAYFAPDDFHMLVGRDHRIILSGEKPENALRPSVSSLFRSVAETFGCDALGVLLTGMGRDGADDLKLLRNRGAVTIVQDRESSIIFGMPGEAVKIDAADFIMAPEAIARFIAQLIRADGDKK